MKEPPVPAPPVKAPHVTVKVEREEKKEKAKEHKGSKGQSCKEKKRHRRQEREKNRGRRGGRKHQQVHRRLSDPSIRVHKRRGVSELRSLRERDDFNNLPPPPPCPR